MVDSFANDKFLYDDHFFQETNVTKLLQVTVMRREGAALSGTRPCRSVGAVLVSTLT